MVEMIWLLCKDRGHHWKSHRGKYELAYWHCRRFGCKEERMAPWYIAYRAYHRVVPGSALESR